MVEFAIVAPVLTMLIVGGLVIGLAIVDDIRMERVAGDSARLDHADAEALVATVGGKIVCWWEGTEDPGCFQDGMSTSRRQVIVEGRTWPLFGFEIMSGAYAVVPVE